MSKYINQIFFTLFIAIALNSQARNLLTGDASVETECRNMTYGAWGKTVPGNPSRLEYAWDDLVAYNGTKSVRISKVAEVSAMAVNGLQIGQEYTFSYWAKAEPDGTVAYISAAPFLRSTWRTRIAKRKKIILGKAWQRFTYTFTAKGKYNYVPIYGLSQTTGAAWFDAFQLELGGKATKWQSPTPVAVGIQPPVSEGNVYLRNSLIPIKILAKLNTLDKLSDPMLKLTVEDYLGKRKIVLMKKFVFNNAGIGEAQLESPAKKLGWFAFTAEILQNGKILGSDYQTLAIVAPPVKIAAGIQPFSGISMSDAFPEAFLKIGVRWLESVVKWHYAERKQGVYDFDYLLHYSRIRKYKKMGFKNKVLIDAWGVPDWLLTDEVKAKAKEFNFPARRFGIPTSALGHWQKFIQNFLAQNRDTVDMIEIGAELDVVNGLNTYYKSIYPNDIKAGFVIGKPADEIGKAITVAINEIKKQLPNTQISAVRPSDVDTRKGFVYSAEIFKRCGKNITAFGLDCYPRPRWIGPGQPVTGRPLDLKNIYEQAKRVAIKYCAESNIYISEYGYFIDYNSRNESKYQLIQANRLARSFLVAKAVGLQQLFWYSGQKPANSLEAGKYMFAIWANGMPFIAVPTYSAVARVVENITTARLLQPQKLMAGGIYRKNSGSAVAALWSIDQDYRPTVILNDPTLKITDLMGNPLEIKPLNGKLTLKIDEQPLYLWRTASGDDNYAKLTKTIDEMTVVEKIPVDLFFRLASAKRLKIYMKNRSFKQDHAGYLQYTIAGKSFRSDKFQIPSNETAIVNIALTGKYRAGAKIDFVFYFAGTYKPFKQSFSLPEVYSVVRVKDSFSIDGSLNKWTKFTPIIINTKSNIMPRDFTTWRNAEDLSFKLYVVHDMRYLYLAALVKDDMHFNKFSKKNLWKGDSFQFAFDPKTNFIGGNGTPSPDIYNLILAYANGKQTAFQYSGKNIKLLEQSQYIVKRDIKNNNTFYEIKIPLKSIDIKTAPGNIFGFNAVFLDDDSGSGQDYWMFLKPGLAGGTRPDKFALFKLEP